MSKFILIIVLATLNNHLNALDVCKDVNSTTDCQSCINTSYPVQSPYIDNCMKTCGVCKSGENVAVGKQTNQSSTVVGGISSRAVDGNTDSYYFNDSCTHTTDDNPEWWCVNLQQIYNIMNITIYNRDTHQHRLRGFEVKISSSDQCNRAGLTSATSCYKDKTTSLQSVYTTESCNQPSSTSLSARTVFISVNTDSFNLCEVQIYTDDICSDGYYNISNSRCKACNTCANNKCNPESGICNNGCKDGYKDSRCTKPCPTNCVRCNGSSCSICKPGWYGTNCNSMCSGNCNRGCNKSNGICNECKQGTLGLFCDIECGAECQPIMEDVKELNECDVDQDCNRNCDIICSDESCNQKTLSCSYGCIAGKKGMTCSIGIVQNEEPIACSSLHPVVIGVIGAVLGVVVTLAVVIVIHCIYSKGPRKREEVVSGNVIYVNTDLDTVNYDNSNTREPVNTSQATVSENQTVQPPNEYETLDQSSVHSPNMTYASLK